MKNLKALVIENTGEIAPQAEVFCQQGLISGLFDSVEYNIRSLHETPEDMYAAILKNNCIVVYSKWLYADQIEQFVSLFATKLSHKSYTFFIWNEAEFNKWWRRDYRGFRNRKTFLNNFKKLLKIHQVYPVREQTIQNQLNYENIPHTLQKD